jgi:hypothetical protein
MLVKELKMAAAITSRRIEPIVSVRMSSDGSPAARGAPTNTAVERLTPLAGCLGASTFGHSCCSFVCIF